MEITAGFTGQRLHQLSFLLRNQFAFLLRRGSKHVKNQFNLVSCVCPWQKGPPSKHFREYTPYGPQINLEVILLPRQKQLRSPIPSGLHVRGADNRFLLRSKYPKQKITFNSGKNALASPKSQILRSQFRLTSKFFGFKSL